MSRMRQHFQKKLMQSDLQKAQDEKRSMATLPVYERTLAQLNQHQRLLKSIKSTAQKIARKREMLPDYIDYVDECILRGVGEQDEVVVTMMVWSIDTGDISRALTIAEYALRHDLKMPARYDRDTASVIAEEIAGAYLTDPATVTLDQLRQTFELVRERDMHDQIMAKLHKALGMCASEVNVFDEAVWQLERALTLHPDISGVRQPLSKLKKRCDEAKE